jgi:rhodanese-related sulfurtransferase
MKQFALRLLVIAAVALAAALVDGSVRGLKMPPKPDETRVPHLPPRPAGTPAPSDTAGTSTPADNTAAASEDSFTPQLLAELMESPSTILIDARSDAEHRQGRIPNSFHLEPSDLGSDSTKSSLVQFLIDTAAGDPNVQFIIYCGGGDCHASRDLASQMIRYGFREDQLYMFEGGYPAWVEAGYEIQSGDPLF